MSQGNEWCLANWVQKRESPNGLESCLANISEQCGKSAGP